MKPIVHFAHWIYADRMDFPIDVHIYNVHADKPDNQNVYNVLNIANEPEPTRMTNKKVIALSKYFDLILTWDEEILNSCPNARMFLCGMTWIREEDYNNLKPKEFKVSFICGSKISTQNHVSRHSLWVSKNSIKKIPSYFFNSSQLPLDKNYGLKVGINPHDKIEVFNDFQFHIAIENSCYRHYFTEKLMDCFITKTIPIYIGCLNTSDYFNIDGVIQVKTLGEIFDVCNSLTPDYYESKLNAINDNFSLCKQYTRDFTERLQEIITENILNEK